MAETTETVELNLDDKELFQEAMKEPPKEVETKSEEKTDDKPRDEQGRFVKAEETTEEKTETVKAEEVKTEVKDDAAQVPSWRLRELREAREAADRRAEEANQQRYAFEQQMQTMRRELEQLKQPKQEPVNWFENPDGALKQQISPIEAQLSEMRSEMRLNTSRAMAIATHGAKEVSEMEAAVEKAMQSNHPEIPMLRAQMLNSSDPVGVAIQWHKRSKVMELTGGDPDKYRQKILDDALKDPEFRKKVVESVRADPRPNVQLPPSLSKVTGTGASNEVLGDDDMSDRALFKHATRR